MADVRPKPEFGATISAIQFGIEAFAPLTVKFYDMDGNVVATHTPSGGGFDFDHKDIMSAVSGNGISRITFENGSGNVEGWTSVDNWKAETGPPPPPPCYADCDKNGRLDIRDFFCFQAQYAAGCP